MANQAKGAGFERKEVYKNTHFKFLGVDNVHVIRDSQKKLAEHCHPFNIREEASQASSLHLPSQANKQPEKLVSRSS